MTEQNDDLDDLIRDFVNESREHIGAVETQLLKLEEGAGDADTINEVFRCVHSIKGVAGFLGLDTIQNLAHVTESTLDLVRKERLEPSAELISALLESIDVLKELVESPEDSNGADIEQPLIHLRVFMEAAKDSGDDDGKQPAAAAESATQASAPAPAAAKAAGVDAAKSNEAPNAGASKDGAPQKKAAARSSESIRVNVDLLNHLMDLSGEMVLGRNQVLQGLRKDADPGMQTAIANLSQVVSEMQEAIMQTRLQSVGTVFQRFPRIVRDLSAKLGKQCRLELEGNEVELDRSILEALGDPLTHLVRNALDHGVEAPEVRRQLGKPEMGTLEIRAAHKGGNVRIEIVDDGAGIDPAKLRARAVEKGLISADEAQAMSDRDARLLIFAPGFSTAAQLSDVSGRGVGMDVVRSNIEKLGGSVEVQSEVAKGTTLVITIPLTLAILPAMVVTCADLRYVIPQSNVTELVRVRHDDEEQRIVEIMDRDALRLRGRLLPIVHLRECLGLGPQGKDERATSQTIMVVQSGALSYGLVIDLPPDTEEIVVKPLGRHLKNCSVFSGSTLLGDGQVAMILDAAGIAAVSNLSSQDFGAEEAQQKHADTEDGSDSDFVIFRSGVEESFAVPLSLVSRIQRVRRDEVDEIGGRTVHRTEGGVLPIVRLDQHITAAAPAEDTDSITLVVLRIDDREFGLHVTRIDEIHRTSVTLDDRTLADDAVIGSFQLDRKTVRLLDCTALAQAALPDLANAYRAPAPTPDAAALASGPGHILIAEDSGFMRKHILRAVENGGYRVIGAEDGDIAWQILLERRHEIDMVISDIQMPNCDGLELTRRIRANAETADLPVLALTSLSTDEAVAEGRAAGVDEYLVKLDDISLLAAIQRNLGALV